MKFQRFRKNGIQMTSIQGGERLLFAPALFFILLGMLAIIAPRFVLFLVASFFLFIGCIAAFLAYKFVQMRKKFNDVVKDINSRVVIRTADPSSYEFEDDIVVEESKKKIMYH